ncbi:MAG: PaaI family thioesterase [Phycisphaerae bacterium]|nr:PaaI family thioesterase [Phycisphaerales bacterium]
MGETNPYPHESKSSTGYEALCSSCHPDCVACRDIGLGGLGLKFSVSADGGVNARFYCAAKYQGYPDRMHGGIIATLLDAAMTHCLFSRGKRGVTAKLSIRYVRPVEIGADAVISASVISDRGMLVELQSELHQAGRLCASSKATFFVQSPEKLSP